MRTRAVVLAASLVALATGSTCGSDTTGPRSFFLALSTAGSGSGTITASPVSTDDMAYLEGTVVTITASANTGSDFTGWDELDVKGCTEPRNPCPLTMNDRKSVVANFVPSEGVARFDGLYTGTAGEGSSIGAQPVNLTIVNGVVQGKNAPLFGSQNTFSGTVSAEGTFNATIAPGPGSDCATVLSGTITTSLVEGITTATLNGNWLVTSTGGVGCGAGTPLPSGSWSATRDRVHVDKI